MADVPMPSKRTRREAGRGRPLPQAAEDALQQLDWAIGYLHGIRKLEVSQRAREEPHIHPQELMGRSEQPVPSEKTSET